MKGESIAHVGEQNVMITAIGGAAAFCIRIQWQELRHKCFFELFNKLPAPLDASMRHSNRVPALSIAKTAVGRPHSSTTKWNRRRITCQTAPCNRIPVRLIHGSQA